MAEPTREELVALAKERTQPSVSIYMPTDIKGTGTGKNPVRFKTLIGKARRALENGGADARRAEEILSPAASRVGERPFWQQMGHGLGVLLSPSMSRWVRLPYRVPEFAYVGDRFHLVPLLPLIAEGSFYLLALSLDGVMLYRGDRFGLTEVKADLPGPMEEALGEVTEERQLQFHTGTPPATGRRAAVFHGHGDPYDDSERKKDIARYFRLVDQAVHPHVPPSKFLTLAGVDYLLPMYREVTRHPRLADKGIHGNPFTLTPAELHAQALPLVRPHLDRDRAQAHEKFASLSGTGKAITELGEALAAAHHGRVETLFVPWGVHAWGKRTPDDQVPSVHNQPEPGDEDLINSLALETLLTGGAVYTVDPNEIPGAGTIAAVLRY